MITFFEWLELSDADKAKEYKNLSEQDKFRARMGHYYEDSKIIIDENDEFYKKIHELTNDMFREKNNK